MTRQTSSIRLTNPNLNVSRLVLDLALPNPWKSGMKSRMKMNLKYRQQAMLQYIWVINKLIAY